MSPERLIWLIVLVTALAGALIADLSTDWWDDKPFLANTVSGALLLIVTLVLIDEYLRFRAAEEWKSVAAFALEDLARVARAVWVRTASDAQPPLEPITVPRYRRQLRSAGGRRAQREGFAEVLLNSARRDHLFERLRETAIRTREIVLHWGPTMVPHPHLAPYLGELTTLHRQMVQVLRVLNIARGTGEFQIPPAQLVDWLMRIVYSAVELDERLHREAGVLDDLADFELELGIE
jgi:prepilin signal peptidase PulO-like enzyme (type II secretory pathway)